MKPIGAVATTERPYFGGRTHHFSERDRPRPIFCFYFAGSPLRVVVTSIKVRLLMTGLKSIWSAARQWQGLRNRWRAPAAGSLRPQNPPWRRSEITPDFGPTVQLEDRKSPNNKSLGSLVGPVPYYQPLRNKPTKRWTAQWPYLLQN